MTLLCARSLDETMLTQIMNCFGDFVIAKRFAVLAQVFFNELNILRAALSFCNKEMDASKALQPPSALGSGRDREQLSQPAESALGRFVKPPTLVFRLSVLEFGGECERIPCQCRRVRSS